MTDEREEYYEEYAEQPKTTSKGRHGGRRPGTGRPVGTKKGTGLPLTHYWSPVLVETARNCLMLERGRDITDNELRQFIRSAANEGVQAATKKMQDALAERGVIVTAGAIII